MWQVLFTAGLIICVRWDSAAANSAEPLYKEVNGTAVLRPGSAVTGPIKTVTWKHGDDKAAELYKGVIDFYRQFKGRCELNSVTGELTINQLTLSDSGRYSAEINNVAADTVELRVMSPVPKPFVSKRCDATKTYCTLTCEGITSVPESLKYRWKEDNEFSISSKELEITKENQEPEFICEMRNPVSSSRSDPFQNPFISGNSTGIIIGVVVILFVIVIVATALVVMLCRRQRGSWTAVRDRVLQRLRSLWSHLMDLFQGSRTPAPQSPGDQSVPNGTAIVIHPKPENDVQQQPNGDVHSDPPQASGAPNTDTGRTAVGDEEEAGAPDVTETTRLLAESGGDQQESTTAGVHTPPPSEGSSPAASSSGEDNVSTQKTPEDQDQDLRRDPEIPKNTTAPDPDVTETTGLLSESGGDQQESSNAGVHSPPPPPEGPSAAASSSGEDDVSTQKTPEDQDQDQDLRRGPEIPKNTTVETSMDHEGPDQDEQLRHEEQDED